MSLDSFHKPAHVRAFELRGQFHAHQAPVSSQPPAAPASQTPSRLIRWSGTNAEMIELAQAPGLASGWAEWAGRTALAEKPGPKPL